MSYRESSYRWLKVLVCSFSALSFVAGCSERRGSAFTDAELERVSLAQKIQLEERAGGLVLVVGGESITSDEILRSSMEHNGMIVPLIDVLRPAAQMSDIEQFKERARPQVKEIVTTRISDILLYHLAKNKIGDRLDEALDKATEAEMRKFILNFGGDEAKADEKLEQMGMDRESFKKHRKRLMLAQSEITSKLSDDSPVTYGEMMECYDRMKDEFFATPARVQFRLIDIQPSMLEVADPGRDRQELARDLAGGLLARIKAGEDFGELAKQYSHGHRSRFGGLWVPIQPQSLAAPYDRLVDEIEKTQRGEVTDLIEVPGHIFIMKVEEKSSKSYKPFEEVQRQVEGKVISDRWQKVVEKLNAGLEKQASFGERDEFIDFCLEKVYKQETKDRK